MKRKKREKYLVILRCYPWFAWRECVKCHMEFRREHGWAYLPFNKVYYLCQECGPTYEEACDYFFEKFHPPLEEGSIRKGGRNPQPRTPKPDIQIMPQKLKGIKNDGK